MNDAYNKYIDKLRKTPQSEPIPGRGADMIENNAGGYGFKLNKWDKLRRFLILGTEGGTYYVSQENLTSQNVDSLYECIEENPQWVAEEIERVSSKGLGTSNDPALFALAVLVSYQNGKYSKYIDSLPIVARTGTHLFHFANYMNKMRGWGRRIREGFDKWYNDKNKYGLSYQMAKYKSRDGWSHADILRLAHVKPKDKIVDNLFAWALDKDWEYDLLVGLAKVDEDLKNIQNIDDALNYIKNSDERVQWEIIPTQFRKNPELWRMLLPDMGAYALTRNLSNMSVNGVFDSDYGVDRHSINFVVDRLNDKDWLKNNRYHPMQALIAWLNYGNGQTRRDNYLVNKKILNALEDSFYLSFDFVEPTNKRILLAVDVSSSMMWSSGISNKYTITPAQAATCIALILAKTEPKSDIVMFSDNLKLVRDINADSDFQQAYEALYNHGFGGTDCALSMIWATKRNVPYDAFIVLTDNETWRGNIHPSQALKEHRSKLNKNAKLIVLGMTANDISIADPNDAGMLDIVGFSPDVTTLISRFIKQDF